MPAEPLLPPNLQFVDANGKPYAGGFLYTYVPGTFTPKTTWQDSAEAIANSNPIVLNDAGFAVVWGSGDYRLILKDADSVQIFDELSTSPLPSSAISDAMLPVVGALTTAQARMLLGVDAFVDAAISNIELEPGPAGATGPTGPQGIQGPTGSQGDSAFTFSIGNPGYILLGPYGTSPLINFGYTVSDSTGHATGTFAKSFTTSVIGITGTPLAPEGIWMNYTGNSMTTFTAITMSPYAPGSTFIGNIGFFWLSVGQ